MYNISLITLLILMLLIPKVRAEEPKQFIGIEEKLGAYIPADIMLYDETGKLVKLKSLINKPTLIALVYYRCTGICTPLLNETANVIDKIDLEMGKDYQILTISFDYKELPETASEKRDNYLSEIKKPVNASGWRFLTGDSLNIKHLTDSMGFYYERSGDDWIHPTALIAVSPDGKITRYLYGIHQVPLDVKMAVLEASKGQPGPAISKILNMCYTYDPEGKHYVFNFVQVGGIIIIGFIALFVALFIIIPKKKKERP